MSSKNYIKRLFSLSLLIVIFLFIVIYYVHNKYDNNALKDKEYLINKYESKIIFAGDSRAERQIDPIHAKNVLNLDDNKIVNIAISSGDALMVEDLINKYPEKFKDAILVISISQNQFNDNSQRDGYFSYGMISRLDFLNQINVFYPNHIDTLVKYYKYNLKSQIKKILTDKTKTSESFHSTLGFNGIDKTFKNNKLFNIENVNKNPWYENYQDNGIKTNMLLNSLNQIKKKVRKLYLYIGPLSETYKKTVRNTNYWKIEQDIESSFLEICNNLDLECKSYIFDNNLSDEFYYDEAHLNIKGARIFTEMIIKEFNLK